MVLSRTINGASAFTQSSTVETSTSHSLVADNVSFLMSTIQGWLRL
jgi:hypothetical protein